MRLFLTIVIFWAQLSWADTVDQKRFSVNMGYNSKAELVFNSDFLEKFDEIDVYPYEGDKLDTSNSWQIPKSTITKFDGVYTIAGKSPGKYRLVFKDLEAVFDIFQAVYTQDIYIPYPQPNNALELAKQYIPIAIFNKDEEYFPQSLEGILSFQRGDENNSIEIRTSGPNPSLLMGEQIKSFLKYNGSSKSEFNFERGETECNSDDENCTPLFLRESTGTTHSGVPVVYWDASIEADNLYITYWYFYAFDPKGGSKQEPDTGSHAFDRESVTVKFTMNQGEYQPVDITYAGHLKNQRIDFNGCDNHETCSGTVNDILDWKGGKTTLSWDNAIKVGKHPVIYKAKGAHAVYPTYGHYTVVNIGTDIAFSLSEPAGSVASAQVIIPGSFNLQKLDYSQLKYLSFSGSWVDVLGTGTAQFPPFTRLPYSTWLSDTNYVFEECLEDTNCNVNPYFDFVRGLGVHGVTIEVRDPSDQPVPNADVRLVGSDGTYTNAKTLSDGMHTFFFTPEADVTYSLYTSTEEYGEVFCEQFLITNPEAPMANNQPTKKCIASQDNTVGTIVGKITDAVTRSPIQNVFIRALRDGELIATLKSNANGEYSFELPNGTYYLVLGADGYISATISVEVLSNETLTITELRQVSEEYSQSGDVMGVITNAFSGEVVNDITLNVRSGANSREGTVISTTTTSDAGVYKLTLDAGNYTLEIKKEGYETTFYNIVSIGGRVTDNQNSSITPILSDGEIRVILSWGTHPEDLDAHIWTPDIEGMQYHVFYDNKGSRNQAPYVALDTDDRDSYGPETITLYDQLTGTYYYSVHNYSNERDIKESEAQVRIFGDNGLITEPFNIPLSGEGRVWNVFTIDGETLDITRINQISNNPMVDVDD